MKINHIELAKECGAHPCLACGYAMTDKTLAAYTNAVIEMCDAELQRLRAENEALRAAFHRNMVVLLPNKTHDEINEAINRAIQDGVNGRHYDAETNM